MLLFGALMAAGLEQRVEGRAGGVQLGFKVALGLVLAVRLWNAFAFDPRWQHSAKIHLGYLRDLTQLQVPASYNAPWAYLLTLIISAPVSVPLKLLGVRQDLLVHASLGFAQTIFFIFLIAGCHRLGKKLWGPDLGLRFAALVGAFPVVQRLGSMVRAESLLMVLTPWAVLLYLQVAPLAHESVRKLARHAPWLALVAAQTLIVAQKIGGVVILGTVPAFLLARIGFKDSIRLLLKTVPVVLLLVALLIGVQAVLSGHTPLRHDLHGNAAKLCPEGFRPMPISVFLTFQPSLAWNQPFRDVHRASMPGILFIDFHGDYWRHGIDASRMMRGDDIRLSRARYGMVLTVCFGLLWLISSATVLLSKSAAAPMERRNLLAAGLVLLGSAMYLCAASLKFYCPEDGDIVKWEYIAWVFLFLPMPLVAAARVLSPGKARVYDAALLAFTLAGVVQCVVTPLF